MLVSFYCKETVAVILGDPSRKTNYTPIKKLQYTRRYNMYRFCSQSDRPVWTTQCILPSTIYAANITWQDHIDYGITKYIMCVSSYCYF